MSKEKARKDLYPENRTVLGTQSALLDILPVDLNAVHAAAGHVVAEAQGTTVGGYSQLGAVPSPLSV